jgi:hypothetical protein
MSGNRINQLVSEVVRAGLDPAGLQSLLSATFVKSDENPHWTFYTFELNEGPFAGGEFRQNKAGGRALLSLVAREASPVAERDLDLRRWGPVRSVDLNPRIKPEGADAYIYDIDAVKVSFQFTHTSRRLRGLALEWGAAR